MKINITQYYTRLVINTSILMLSLVFSFNGVLNAQVYSNGALSTGATAVGGVTAPTGFTWSELQGTNTSLGSAASIEARFTLADDFFIPFGETWKLSKVVFYAYSTDYVGTTSPFNDTRVQIFDKDPSINNPTPLFGNLTTNRFEVSSTAKIYRIGNGSPGTRRQIWRIEVALGTALAPLELTSGNYWIEWQHGTIAMGASNFSPPTTIVGASTQPSNNAKLHSLTSNSWSNIVDQGSGGAQDFPFDIIYTSTCPSVAANAPIVVASSLTVCSGSSVTLSANGILNNSAGWKYYTGSCGGTLIGSGNSVTVNPTTTTTYYARAEGGCGTTPNGDCGQVTIAVVNCACISPSEITVCEGAVRPLSVSIPAVLPTQTFNSTSMIEISSLAGPASPYPVNMTVAGLPIGATVKSVTLNGVSHEFPSDIDVALVAPNGIPVTIWSDAGGGAEITNIDYTFSDQATAVMPNSTSPSGIYKPTNNGASDVFITPGPGTLVQANPTLSSFTGDMNGDWKLFVVDDAGGDVGSITSWSITFNIPPTAIWTGEAGTMFIDAAATTPYISGSEASMIWVKPTQTSTMYNATINAGTCAGVNNIPVTVLAKPIVTVDKVSSCGPTTITASGANNYSWTPTAGLNTTMGSVVTANPMSTTIYLSTGLNSNGCFSNPTATEVKASPLSSSISFIGGATFQLNEGFSTVLPTGWVSQNNSEPIGPAVWAQGAPNLFSSFNGDPNSYALGNFAAGSGTSTLSNWMISPVINIKNGDVLTFYTRTITGSAIPDRLEVRLSTAGASVNVGSTSTSTGDFSTLLLTVNPNLVSGVGTGIGTSGYPDTWTKLTAVITNVPSTVAGRIAFRYFVTDGGPNGLNSNNIGIDQVEYSTPSSITCPNNVSNLKVDITGGVSPYTLVFSDGTTSTTYNNYISGTLINVSPSSTTTYSIVSVTGANGCLGSGNSGSANIVVTPPAAITTQPVNKLVCVGASTIVSVTPNTFAGTTFQWQVNSIPAPGVPVWTNITNNEVYSNATTSSLNINNVTSVMSGFSYRVLISGFCGGNLISNPAIITVINPVTGIVTLRDTSICANGSASFALGGGLTGGPGITHNFQISNDGGVTFTNIRNAGIFSGATSSTLLVTAAPNTTTSPILYKFRDSINLASACGFAPIYSNVATLTVNPLPVVSISAAPITNLFPGLTSTLTAASSASIYQWFKDGVAIAGANSNNYVVDINNIGTYTVKVNNPDGCSSVASGSNPLSIKIGDSITVDRIFIYPTPNNGQFQVRYYTDKSNGSLVPAIINVYDEKGTRVFTNTYMIGNGYQSMPVNMGTHSSGIYRIT
jgi:subtilisin-like proprotein convertase family protein